MAHYVNSDWARIRRAIGEELHRLERSYVNDYLPIAESFPEFVAQWNVSWFAERVAVGNTARIGVENRSHEPRRVSSDPPDWDAICSRCGEPLAPELRDHGQHLLCE